VTQSTFFPLDFPEYPKPEPVFQKHDRESREAEYGRIAADMDRTGLAGILLSHLWLPVSKACACGMRSDQRPGKHYVWWASHVASLMVANGFSARLLEAGQ